MASAPVAQAPRQPGLKSNAISFISNVVIGVASTAPGYSLAATLGALVLIGGIGIHAPAIMLVAFVPMLFIALAYNYMNRADPDCGTTFSWMTRAMGPSAGWMGGWAIIVADVIVMANLAQIAGKPCRGRDAGLPRGARGAGGDAHGARDRSGDFPIETEIVQQAAVDALVEFADRLDARVIVVGSRGESPLKGAIVGSTPHKLLQVANRPLLVVPE